MKQHTHTNTHKQKKTKTRTTSNISNVQELPKQMLRCADRTPRGTNRSKSLPSLDKNQLVIRLLYDWHWHLPTIFSTKSRMIVSHSSFGVKLITLLNPGEPGSWKTYGFQRCLHTPSAETLRVWLMNVGMFWPPRGCCGKWWIPHLVAFIYLGDSPPFPLPKKGEGDMDPGGNLINLSPFKKLQKKYISKVAEEKWAKSSWGGFHRSSWLFYMSGE